MIYIFKVLQFVFDGIYQYIYWYFFFSLTGAISDRL